MITDEEVPEPAPSLTWDQLRRAANALALQRGEYAGVPMIIQGRRVVMAPRHRLHAQLDGASAGPREGDDPRSFQCSNEDVEPRVVRGWWSRRLRTEVYIVWHGDPRDPDFRVELAYGKHDRALEPLIRWRLAADGLEIATEVWDAEAEMRALATLGDLVTKHQFATYVLTGAFIERGRGICVYMFRKGRPTIVISPSPEGRFGPTAALCMHPLAYFEGTHCGAMVPTDDVIAHLMLKRADEHRFWRVCNQHSIYSWQAGL